jgi:hypothetical protein
VPWVIAKRHRADALRLVKPHVCDHREPTRLAWVRRRDPRRTMKTAAPVRLLPVAALLILLSRGVAQELSFQGGGVSTQDARFSSNGWQVDYTQDFTRWFAASAAYINEGHIPNHHRDGTAFALWGRVPLFHDRVALSAGVGAYYYYDTQPLGPADTADVHGTAPIYSLSAIGYLSNRWFMKATYNRIEPRRDVKTNMALVGLGFWFGPGQKPAKGHLGDAPVPGYAYVTGNEITLFSGQSVVNTFLSQKALAAAAEYRRGIIPHIDWTASAIYEGDPKIVRRNGLATQLWAVNTFFDGRISVGAGLGPYFYLDRRHPAAADTKLSPAAAAPLLSLTIATRLSDHWLVRAVFDRVTSNYNRDSDIFLVGLGYSWGARAGG